MSNQVDLSLNFRNFEESFFEYRSLAGIQLYYGVDEEVAKAIKDRKIKAPEPDDVFSSTIVFGGRGSGKTWPSLFIMLRLAQAYEDNLIIFVRKRWNELLNSIVADFNQILDDLTKVPNCTAKRCESGCLGHRNWLVDGPHRREGFYEYEVYTHGKPSRIIVKPEPEAASSREIEDAFKGPQYGGVLLDEATQLKEITFSTLEDNLRRPNIPQRRLLAMTNPPTESHWLGIMDREERIKMGSGEKCQRLMVQASMEANPFLPLDYREQMKRKYKNDPIKYARYILGEVTPDVAGTPVFRGAFDIEGNCGALKFNIFRPLIVGMDFGWHHPAAVFLQLTEQGHINVLSELRGSDITAKAFGKLVKDHITQNYRAASKVIYYGDPAGSQRTDKSDDTTFSILRREHDIKVGFRRYRVEHGLDQLRNLMTDYGIGGRRPRLMFNKKMCRDLVAGMLGGYRYKESAGVVKDSPFKDNYYDHAIDALRYAINNIVHVERRRKSNGPRFAGGMDPRRGGY